MLTEYRLDIGGTEYVLGPDEIRNWQELKVSYKRTDFDGVVRSFSSQFEFVGRARNLIWNEYLSKGFNAQASVSIYVLDHRWRMEKKFSCPLDFSTLSVEDYVLEINCLDTTLASVLNARKSVKYEYTVGEDIQPDGQFHYDRLPMQESATYEFTKGVSQENKTDILVTLGESMIPWIGNVGSEITVNRLIHFAEDQEDKTDAYCLKAYADTTVKLDYSYAWRTDKGTPGAIDLGIRIRRGNALLPATELENGGSLGRVTGQQYRQIVGQFYPGNLPDLTQEENPDHIFVVINGFVWKPRYNGSGWEWLGTNVKPREFFKESNEGSLTVDLKEGDELVIVTSTPAQPVNVMFLSSQFVFKWISQGMAVEIEVVKPLTLCKAILTSMTGTNTSVVISDYDERLADTYLMAAESIRGFKNAKLYSSFSEFCEWMSTVFGYIYEIVEYPNGAVGVAFRHRKEVFSDFATVRRIKDVKDVKFSLDTSVLYSSVQIGYNKKDYGNINGIDEFNFNSTFTTGYTLTDKTLSLISKYRADSYGIEFAAQKRGEETTDSSSDQDVFFVLCVEEDEMLMPDRSIKIEGTLSTNVFNGAFSPRKCIIANEHYIAIQAYPMILEFASSEGNSSVVIDGVAENTGAFLPRRMVTAGTLEFKCGDTDDIADVDELIEVTDSEGVTYRGYLRETEISYAEPQSVTYKLIVKETII